MLVWACLSPRRSVGGLSTPHIYEKVAADACPNTTRSRLTSNSLGAKPNRVSNSSLTQCLV